MTQDQLFESWAPQNGTWSAWVKPVLFAYLDRVAAETPAQSPMPEPEWVPRGNSKSVVVVDLPAVESVHFGMLLARRGFRPIPLFNSVPIASTGFVATDMSACDMFPAIAALAACTIELKQLHLPADAPPAFLLDSVRRVGTRLPLMPGMFDNRSVSLPTDFPSGNLLISRGIARVLLVQAVSFEPQPDLAHTLLRWQQLGISIESMALASTTQPTQIDVRRPPFYRMIWQRLAATIGLRSNPLGGFGGVLPIPSSSGG